jgi:hypothetical protein
MASKAQEAVPHEEISRESAAVHAWRVRRLTGLGVACAAAEAAADRVDWHEVAKLVKRGCPAPLALAIVG